MYSESNGIIDLRDPCEQCHSQFEICSHNALITGGTNFAGGIVITLGAGIVAAIGAPPTVGAVLAIGLVGSFFNAAFNYAGAVNICDSNLQYCLELHECPGAGNPKSGCEYFMEVWE